jgi:Na+/H+-translocating membrane pyrophosphatase
MFKVSSNSITICCILGLYSGLVIGWFTDYCTSNSSRPVQELAESCKKGGAINVINGLALGYYSCAVPVICITGTIYFAFEKAKMYGIAIAALGMLSNLCVCLSIDAYGPISDNAGGLAELAGFGSEEGSEEQVNKVREKTDDLDAAGNTTAAIGKGFAIGSACLVSLALFGAFVTRTQTYDVDILEPIEMTCLVIGAMIPYAFSALTMKSVGKAASEMVRN